MLKKSLPQWLTDLLGRTLNTLLPPRCAVCKRYLGLNPNGPLCPTCQGAAHIIKGPLCWRCGTPFHTQSGPDHLCGACMADPPPWTEARGLYYYKGSVKELIHHLKFKKRPSATVALAYLAAQNARPKDWAYDLIVPIPISKKRLKQRGFNQCLELAKAIFHVEKGKIDPFSLIKTRDNPPQSGLSKNERMENVKGVFKAHSHRVKGQRILLFDDIYTTGATAKEASKALKGAGAETIYLLTLARV